MLSLCTVNGFGVALELSGRVVACSFPLKASVASQNGPLHQRNFRILLDFDFAV